MEPPAARLTWEQVRAWRVQRQHLAERAPAQAALSVVSRLCGVHAQLMSSAELSLWARVEGLTRFGIGRRLWDGRTLVKMWAMRGTLHLLPSREFGLWSAGLSTYRNYETQTWLRYFGLTGPQLERTLVAVGKVLRGRILTREELAGDVARLTRSAALGDLLRESWGALLKPASFRGQLCFGPSAGHRVRFTHPDTWLRDQGPTPDPDDALGKIALRYLEAYGPATREQFSRWWANTSPAQAERLMLGLGDQVATVEVEGERAWLPAGHVAEAAEASLRRSVRLLPAFDQFVVTANREPPGFMEGPFRGRIYRPAAWLSPVLLVNGRMDGVWRHERKRGRLVVTVEPFAKVPAWVRRGAEQEAERMQDFLGGTLEFTWVS